MWARVIPGHHVTLTSTCPKDTLVLLYVLIFTKQSVFSFVSLHADNVLELKTEVAILEARTGDKAREGE